MNKPAPSTTRRNVLLCFLLLVLLAPSIAVWMENRQMAQEAALPLPSGPHVNWEDRVQEIKAEALHLEGEAARTEARLWADFQQKMEALHQKRAAALEQEIRQSVNSLTSVGALGDLIKNFAMDQVLGGSRAPDCVEGHSQGFIRELTACDVREGDEINKVAEALTALNNDFAMKVGTVIDTKREGLPPATCAKLQALKQEIPRDCAIHVGTAVMAMGLEVATRDSTAQALKVVLEFMARALAPQIGKAATAVGLVEIPVVDIFSVVLAAWTVYDVVTLPGQIHGDVEQKFREAKNGHLRALDERNAKAIGDLSEQSRSSRAGVVASLHSK